MINHFEIFKKKSDCEALLWVSNTFSLAEAQIVQHYLQKHVPLHLLTVLPQPVVDWLPYEPSEDFKLWLYQTNEAAYKKHHAIRDAFNIPTERCWFGRKSLKWEAKSLKTQLRALYLEELVCFHLKKKLSLISGDAVCC